MFFRSTQPKPIAAPDARNAGRFAAPAVAKPANSSEPPAAERPAPPAASAGEGAYIEMKVRLHQQLLEIMNLQAIDKMQPDEFRREVGEMVRELLSQDKIALNAQERNRLVDDIIDELLGLGPIEPLLKDPTVNDILINTYAQVYVERAGKLEVTPVKFKDDRHLLRIINKIVAQVGRRIDESQPLVDARLPDGSRVNAAIPPV
ncbi:MAG TPA: ATPase, T2SS/T4P/T4SS family, partial [Azospirillaceae bacterium]|nr:ATPase, T2SS/T4P/T4SS family [Azospirillaceae bacterium]